MVNIAESTAAWPAYVQRSPRWPAVFAIVLSIALASLAVLWTVRWAQSKETFAPNMYGNGYLVVVDIAGSSTRDFTALAHLDFARTPGTTLEPLRSFHTAFESTNGEAYYLHSIPQGCAKALGLSALEPDAIYIDGMPRDDQDIRIPVITEVSDQGIVAGTSAQPGATFEVAQMPTYLKDSHGAFAQPAYVSNETYIEYAATMYSLDQQEFLTQEAAGNLPFGSSVQRVAIIVPDEQTAQQAVSEIQAAGFALSQPQL